MRTAVIPSSVDAARAAGQNLLDLEEVPLLVAERAGGARLEPPLDAVQVEDVPAASPSYAESRVISIPCGICLHSRHALHYTTLTGGHAAACAHNTQDCLAFCCLSFSQTQAVIACLPLQHPQQDAGMTHAAEA